MKTITDWIIRVVFEKIPILKQLNGYKRLVGNILLVLAAALYAAQTAAGNYFPGVDIPYLDQVIAWVGIALRVLGDMHSDAKARA